MNNYEALYGEVFGRLTVLRHTGNYNMNKSPKFLCRCSCGNTSEVAISSLRSGHTKSCGCLNKEIVSVLHTTHGKSRSKVYRCWAMAKDRCTNPNNPAYNVYGGSGVFMSEEFIDNAGAWCNYLGDPPDDRRWSVDRINPFGNYVRGNLRWSLPSQQSQNTKMKSDNSSGFNGVCWWTDNAGNTYAKAFWTDLEKKSKCKVFSVKKFGLLPAFSLACKYRLTKIKELNDSGAMYTKYHGVKS